MSTKNLPSWLQEKRKKAIELFQAVKDTQKEQYGLGVSSHVPIPEQVSKSITIDERSHVFCADGRVTIVSMQKACIEYEDKLKEIINAKPKSKEKLGKFHDATVQRGVFIIVPKGCNPTAPIVIRQESLTTDCLESIFIFIEDNNTLQIIEERNSKEIKTLYSSSDLFIHAKNNVHLKVLSTTNLSRTITSHCKKIAQIGKDSSVTWYIACSGSQLSHHKYITQLLGKASSAKTNILFLAENKEHHNIYVSSDHIGSNSISDMVIRGIAQGESQTIVRGYVKVKEGAKNCKGYQQEDTLVLSDCAEVDLVPNLEIANNDVECSHGATVGTIDKEQLFYLQARGLTKQEAERLIVKGFFAPGLEGLKEEEQEKLLKYIKKQLEK